MPRVAQDQYAVGPQLPPGTPFLPGDLVFFGGGRSDVFLVGLVVRLDVMVDAPYTGADVREDTLPTTVGATWGGDVVVGFTRPVA
ncbi:MAG: NlpC/P60 family protein [Ferrimicrobium sp.]